MTYYLTLFLPGGVRSVVGKSWFGSLLALFLSKDPSMVFEMVGTWAMVAGNPVLSIDTVGELASKYIAMVKMNSLSATALADSAPYAAAIRNVYDSPLKMVTHVGTRESLL